MLFFFISFSCSTFVAIDLGSQYLRIAKNTLREPVTMAMNENNKMMTPSAIAFKLPKYSGKHMTMEDALKCEIKYGDSAIKLLKSKPQSGFAFLPRIIGRLNSSKFEIPNILNSTEMMAILFKKVLSNIDIIEGVSVTIPNYYTLSQRECIMEALKLANLPLFSLLDDSSAIIQLYTIYYSKKFIYESQSVLFVDIGASAVRAYRVVFTQNETDAIGTQTSYEWTEKTGGFEFIRKVSEYENCSFTKAQKLLLSGKDYSHLFEEDLEMIYDLVRTAVDGEVDEVQLIGGASRFPFVVECIQKVVGYTDILKDLPQMNTIALGSLHIMLSTLNQSKFKLIPVTKPPIYTSYVKCGNREVLYCTFRKKCASYLPMEAVICKTATIFSKSTVPEGSNQVLATFEFSNISNFHYDPERGASGFLIMQPPAPFISSSMWCTHGSRQCESIETVPSINEDPLYTRKKNFVESILEEDTAKMKKNEFRARLDFICRKCRSFNNENVQLDKFDQETEDMLFQAEKIVDHQIDMSVPEMRQFLIHLEKKVKAIQINLEE